ncbi:MAG TPA: serine/threonine-protein kinase [Myxococcaceae bacterium]|nr:serine/threonine-protein kinase [Myxococcaceae bacterium]
MEVTVGRAPVSDDARCVGCAEPTTASRCPHCGVAQRAGGYTVERVLAQGPHARVYVAADSGGNRVALKELQFATVPSVQELDAFEREADALRTLKHPGIPAYVGRFREGQGVALRLYLAFELIAGETLASRLVRGPLTVPDALRLVERLLDILGYLHGRTPPVLHRDLKPANVVLRPDGTVALVDFGSVRTLTSERTHGSTLVGTFGYMPPEQLGGTVDRTSDLYALGATLLHALTGRAPSDWLGPSLQLRLPPGLPAPFDAWLPRMLELDPARRPPDVTQARALLHRPLIRRPPRLLLAVVVGSVVAIVGTVVALSLFTAAVTRRAATTDSRPSPPLTPGRAWLNRVRPRCNAVEALQVMLRDPPPATPEGAGAGAACLALGGKMDAARTLIVALPVGQRALATGVVFEAGHPAADMGDDVSAAPIMKLVLEFWPENYQALYHAGMSEYALGRPSDARPLLEKFLELYTRDDGFTRAAKQALKRIDYGLPPESGSRPVEH